MLEKQEASFVSPSTKELKIKPLGNLTLNVHILYFESKDKTKEKNTPTQKRFPIYVYMLLIIISIW